MPNPSTEHNVLRKLIARASTSSHAHTSLPTFGQLKALPAGTLPKLNIIISCCDPRIHPELFFGLEPGLEYTLIQNAGGRAKDALRSIICMDSIAGVAAVVVVHHTDCGLTHLTNDSIRQRLLGLNPGLEEADVGSMEFGEITDIAEGVREDVAFLRNSPFVSAETEVYGCVYDIATGKVEEIE